jgi:hypothetical protein
MFDQSSFIADFDDQNRILHLSHTKKIHLRTKTALDSFFEQFTQLLDKYIDSGRVYLIINMSNLVIEQDLAPIYARHAKKIARTYIYLNGIARYGYVITRVMVKRGYSEYLNENPNIFNSREEAEEYITDLINNRTERISVNFAEK